MIAIQRILYATDFSPASAPAWAQARLLGQLLKAEVLALHVVAPVTLPEGYIPPRLSRELVEAGHREAHEELDRLAESVTDPALRVSARVAEGSPAPQILAVAREEAADLIVMGTHGRTGLGRLFLGSVADTVVRLAPCPVITVRRRPDRPEASGLRLARITYATDFSATARAAWPFVVALAEASGAAVDLLHVVFEPVPDRHLSPEALGAMARHLREQGEAEAERFLRDSPLPRERVHVLIRNGVVGEQIVLWAEARSADLIVMGTHGWSGPLRWMLGSAAHHVIQLAPCPVLTVGPESRREEQRHGA